jgi:hypothetical protein
MSSNSLSNSILQTSDSSMPNLSSTSSSSSISGESFLDGLKNMNATTWVLVLLILTFLGFNIFLYLAKGTEQLNSVFGPIISTFSSFFGKITGQVVNVSAEGAKKVVNTSAGAIDTGLTAVQGVTSNNSSNSVTPNTANTTVSPVPVTKNQPDVMSNNALNKALNSSQSETQQPSNDYEADEASSSIQSGPPKSGWCYIGEDRGFRTCAQVGVNDKCMSGDIFPSQEICVNPNLRA